MISTEQRPEPQASQGIAGILEAATPIASGWCIKTLYDGRCIDVLKMLYNYRVVISRPDDAGLHEQYVHGWCYFGHGVDAAGTVRTMEHAKIAAILAAAAWDGAGSPPGYDKQAC